MGVLSKEEQQNKTVYINMRHCKLKEVCLEKVN